tara:strand:+ start:1222 stop:1500 length:279 start_codon:yes stop_codon:yes gene_type:complete
VSSRRTKAQRLNDQAQVAHEVKQLFEHPLVQKHLARERDQLIRTMTRCAPTDDDGRRASALQLQALEDFIARMTGRVVRGERAAAELQEMNK